MMDILPTLAEISGGAVPGDRKIDRKSIWPLLSGMKRDFVPHDIFYFFRSLQLQAVRQGIWKLHLKSGELYNLQEDVGEVTDVSYYHTEVAERLYILAEEMESDLGKRGTSIFEGTGTGCRSLGFVKSAKSIIDREGKVREDFLFN